MAMNSLFDLDAALTMDFTNNSFVTMESETKTTESSKVESKVEDLLIMMMPTDLSTAAGVCTVCMEAWDTSTPTNEDGGRIVKCGHAYHERCIRQWVTLHNSCPLCRTILSGDSKSPVVPPSS
ncbi:Zinc finger, RING/FYVE/PHD-type [Heracleum sosnowskyi]|uniref:RING-type E3 ubiquitin transferase n=1 Tax=Heracleum sosnowskyi TaxID=360622 RepID=A0AAD8GV12_9APIA|nr:Zinc finger, RING/FYVE/PHD-type [Heracleum sosnowskyi]